MQQYKIYNIFFANKNKVKKKRRLNEIRVKAFHYTNVPNFLHKYNKRKLVINLS